MPRQTTPIEFNEEGYPKIPLHIAETPHGAALDALVAREFLGLQLVPDSTGVQGVYRAVLKPPLLGNEASFGRLSFIPYWSVSGDEALYLLDFVTDFEIGTTTRGVRCSVWVEYQYPSNPEATYEVNTYGEANKDEFHPIEAGFSPPLGLAICRAVYNAALDMNDVMTELHHANVKRVLGTLK